jgi:hypothetical protein
MGRINSAEITCSTRCGKWVSMKSEVDFFKWAVALNSHKVYWGWYLCLGSS